MNQLLANVAVLKQKGYNFHWNVKGYNFMLTHKVTEAFYEGLIKIFDDVAEKISMNGEIPFSTYKEYLENSTIKEAKSQNVCQSFIYETLCQDLDTLEKKTNEVVTSPTIQPLLDEIYMFIDKQRWIMKSHLSKKCERSS